MAGQPKKRERRRRYIAAKIAAGGALNEADLEFLEIQTRGALNRYKPFTAEDARREHERVREQRRLEREVYKKAYLDVIERALGDVAQVQMLALQRALKSAENEAGELDPALVDEASLRVALGVARDLADRVVGKATQKVEGRVKHEHGVAQDFWDGLAASGELDVIEVEVEDVRELEAGDDA